MKICNRHNTLIESLDPQADLLKIITEYHEEMNVLDFQDTIDYRKNPCQVCFFGGKGTKVLRKIIKKEKFQKIKLILKN